MTESINPFSLEAIFKYNYLSLSDIDDKINAADIAQKKWSKVECNTRASILYNAATILEDKAAVYGEIITNEMGKTKASAIAEIKKCAWVCRYYADHAANQLDDRIVETDAHKSYITYQPLGVILAVMPWNYPFWQVFRFIAPALMAGNGAVLKHASNVPQSAQLIEDILLEAGLPVNVFQNLYINSKDINTIIKNPIIKATTLTGSENAGIAVAKASASELKKSVLELGGSDPYIICNDANILDAAKKCATSRLLNNGQSCIGAKRFIVDQSIYDAFLDAFTTEMEKSVMGNPMNETTTLGPMARLDLRDELHQQVMDSVKAGAKLHIGGYIPDIKGAFYPPTILTDVNKSCPAYHEEFFGPVASIIKVKNINEAITIANDTSFGLGACIFSKNIEEAERIAREELQAGCCFVNQFVKSDPRLPFGGIKRSGYGRELSEYGIKEFVNIKTVYIQ